MGSSSRDRAEARSTNDDRRREETERYRQAADDALQQLDWCIGYIHGIRKVRISRVLARNRTIIRKNLLRRPEEPLPSSRATE